MRRIRWVLLAGLVMTLLATVPAFGGDTALKRVKKLERRVNAIARLEINSDDLIVRTYDSPMVSRGGTYYEGSVSCARGNPTGGGVLWKGGQFAANNRVYFSNASPVGWTAAVDAGGSTARPYVQVVCADLD